MKKVLLALVLAGCGQLSNPEYPKGHVHREVQEITVKVVEEYEPNIEGLTKKWKTYRIEGGEELIKPSNCDSVSFSGMEKGVDLVTPYYSCTDPLDVGDCAKIKLYSSRCFDTKNYSFGGSGHISVPLIIDVKKIKCD